jgi:hypothetical protein
MSIAPESLKVGECYLTHNGSVRRILRLLPEGRVHYELRPAEIALASGWKESVLGLNAFAVLV